MKFAVSAILLALCIGLSHQWVATGGRAYGYGGGYGGGYGAGAYGAGAGYRPYNGYAANTYSGGYNGYAGGGYNGGYNGYASGYTGGNTGYTGGNTGYNGGYMGGNTGYTGGYNNGYGRKFSFIVSSLSWYRYVLFNFTLKLIKGRAVDSLKNLLKPQKKD